MGYRAEGGRELTFGSAMVDAGHVQECATDLVVLHGELELLKAVTSHALRDGVQDKVSIKSLLHMRCQGSTFDELLGYMYRKVGVSTATEPHPHPYSHHPLNNIDTHSYVLPWQQPHPHTYEAMQHTSQDELQRVGVGGCGSGGQESISELVLHKHASVDLSHLPAASAATVEVEQLPQVGQQPHPPSETIRSHPPHERTWPPPPPERIGPRQPPGRTRPHLPLERTGPHPPPERTGPHQCPCENPAMQKQTLTPTVEGSNVIANTPAPSTNQISAHESLSKHQGVGVGSRPADLQHHSPSTTQASSESIELRSTHPHQLGGGHMMSLEQQSTCSQSSTDPVPHFNASQSWECSYCLALVSSRFVFCDVCGRDKQDSG